MTDRTEPDPPGDDAPASDDSTVAVVESPPPPSPARPDEPDRPDELDADPSGNGDRDATADDGSGAVRGGAPPWVSRAGRRIVRRPVDWASRPWPTPRVVKVAVTALSLFLTTYVMLNVVHVTELVFRDNTPTGGDMGAHVWGPAFLRDHLLPNWQLNGWSMDWYAGMPVYRFYMVVPALAMVALDVLLPYGVAFKVVAISGLVTLPFCCWAFGRLARFRYPLPELFAFAGMAFALDESFSIYGGNLKSTMAGEFSFSIALSLMILGFGLLVRSMQTGRLRCWTAIVLALAIVCHGIVAIYTVLGAIVIVVVHLDTVKRLVHGALIGLAVVLLSLWWIGPFVGNHQYMTDMKYGARPEGASDSFWDMFFPLAAPLDILISALAIVGFAACVARRHLAGAALGITALVTIALVYLTRDSLPVIGLLWNPRLLPYLYVLRYLLMMVGAVEVVGWVVNAWRDRSAREEVGWLGGSVAAGGIALAVLGVLGFTFEVLPGGDRRVFHDESKPVYAWGPLRKTASATDAQGDGWARYNFMGYEGRSQYPEYHDLVQTMADLGRTNACGRASWENSGDNGGYGTTMALMLLPHWTDGCITSMEGLFFEASGTTPYHFLTTAAMSEQSSNPVRELRYDNNDAEKGVPYLQALGVRYVMVRTDEAKREAEQQPELALLASSGPWDIYEVADSDVVEPLQVQPVVVERRPGDQRERNLELGTSWFQHRDEWAAMPADDGPEDWQRITVAVDDSRRVPDPSRDASDPDTRSKQVDIVVPEQQIEPVALPEVTVSDVQIDQQDISFEVDQPGVPVLVKVSYFPNWTADGAEGPYRIAPNLMVVVPTEREVSLSFERSSSDLLFYLLTLVGIGLLVLFRIRGDVDLRPALAGAARTVLPERTVEERADPASHDAVWREAEPPPAEIAEHDDPATNRPTPDGPPGRPLA